MHAPCYLQEARGRAHRWVGAGGARSRWERGGNKGKEHEGRPASAVLCPLPHAHSLPISSHTHSSTHLPVITCPLTCRSWHSPATSRAPLTINPP